MGAAMAATETSPATAVERALSILEAAAQRREGLTNAEISRKLGIPKSSASYILRTLEKRSYLRREAETGRYRLGLKILSLGGDAQANLDIADVALPFMRSLVERIHLTVHLAVLDQSEAGSNSPGRMPAWCKCKPRGRVKITVALGWMPTALLRLRSK
ncbi:MAG: hypothetical protein DMG53_06555 [Acidobacteria bacterium]|nr:MAG: hypothetical protein DMG53_06555 [Acidobacteriota bacterium]